MYYPPDMARILVTGGCGFIGSHVVDALVARGDQVLVLDNLSSGSKDYLPDGASLTMGDVSDPEAVTYAMRACDGVVHLAAIASVEQCRQSWATSHRSNVLGAVTVMDVAATSVPSVPVVYASSAAVYGNNATLPLLESEPAAPLTSYGLDKWANERYAEMANRTYGLSTVGLRFFNVYGPRQNPASPYSGVISLFADAAKNRTPIQLYGDGTQTRDFIYVGDVVKLVLAALDYASATTTCELVNGCTGKQTSLLDLIALLNAAYNTTLEVHHSTAREGDILHSVGSPARAAEKIGFTAGITLAKGLDKIG